ncbi:histone-like nucleoid-structuring protein Lsr2 [Rothia terrae]|uniref:Lsr2 family protein n=1 Tax=Rothia terrae TaxID=396015 RepID=A0A7S6WWF1_9MICC|nr:Lsr2 family protein [Rothia terrae]QOW64773.1 Lsr2 family protein [Rothia terrae]
MAQKVKIVLEDDLFGGSAEETVRFGLDGKRYEMDLSAENATKLREALRPFANKARRFQTEKRSTPKQRVTSQPDGETPKIRAWAQENGYTISARGRVHQHIKDAYYVAQKASSREE